MITNIKKILIIFLVLISAGGVLMVSMSRASLEIMTKDEKEGNLRLEPVIFQDKIIYKLPQTNMLSDNVFYCFKEARDWLWQKFSVGNEKEAKVMFILADKKIAEARTLANKGKYNLAFESSIKAVNKLKYTNELVEKMNDQNTAQEQMIIQIRDATYAYDQIIKEIRQKDGSDDQKYLLLQQNLNDFKEKQIKKEADYSN